MMFIYHDQKQPMNQYLIDAVVNKHMIQHNIEEHYAESFRRFLYPNNSGAPYLHAVLHTNPMISVDAIVELVLSTIAYDIDAKRYFIRFSSGPYRNEHLYVYPDEGIIDLLFPDTLIDLDCSQMKTNLTRQMVAELCVKNEYDEWSVYNQGYCETSMKEVLKYLLDMAVLCVHMSDISDADIDYVMIDTLSDCDDEDLLEIHNDITELLRKWQVIMEDDIDLTPDNDDDYEITYMRHFV